MKNDMALWNELAAAREKAARQGKIDTVIFIVLLASIFIVSTSTIIVNFK